MINIIFLSKINHITDLMGGGGVIVPAISKIKLGDRTYG